MDNKTYLYGIKNLITGKWEAQFINNKKEYAKLLFGEFMIGKKAHEFNLYAIGECKNIKQMLIWSGLEADFSNKCRDLYKKEDENNEKTYTQINLIDIKDDNTKNKNENREINEEIIIKLFNGRSI